MRLIRFGTSMFMTVALTYSQAALDNATILKLVKAGIGEDTIVSMVNQQPGRYALSGDDIIALKSAGVSEKVIATMIVRNGANKVAQPAASVPATAPVATQPINAAPLILHDATPVRLRLSRNLTSADAYPGQTIDFEVLDDLKVDDVLVLARGGTAIGTITQAEHKKRMARGGKLDVNIDYVRLVNGEKVTLRAVKEAKGGGHTGAMTGGMVATAIVFFPAAPFFLFMHGRDVTIPKGTEITAYVDGEIKLERHVFSETTPGQPVAAYAAPLPPSAAPPANLLLPAPPAAPVDITFLSIPADATVAMGGKLLGRTPFTIKLQPGTYKAQFSAEGFAEATGNVPVEAGYPNTFTFVLHANN